MRTFFDTEFTTLQADADAYLISAGFASEDGDHEFYAQITDFPRHDCSPFVREVVLPLLDAPAEQRFTKAGVLANDDVVPLQHAYLKEKFGGPDQ